MTLLRDSYRHIRSAVFAKRPLPTDVLEGELAVGYHAGSVGVYLRDTSGEIRKVGPAHVGVEPPQPTNYTTLSDGELWVDRSGIVPVLRYWEEASGSWASTGTSILFEKIIGLGENNWVELESYNKSQFTSGKYLIEISTGSGEISVTELIVTHNNSNTYLTEYGNIGSTATPLGEFQAVFTSSGGVDSVSLQFKRSLIILDFLKVRTAQTFLF